MTHMIQEASVSQLERLLAVADVMSDNSVMFWLGWVKGKIRLAVDLERHLRDYETFYHNALFPQGEP